MAHRTQVVQLGWNYLKVYKNDSKTEHICRYILHNAGDQKQELRRVENYIFFIYFLFWNIAFQMPASLRLCKMRTLLTAPSMSWNRDSQKIVASAKDNLVQPPFPLDWWVSSCHWGDPSVLCRGNSASLCSPNVLQELCGAESCPW